MAAVARRRAVLGFTIQQAVRSRFEAGEKGYRSPQRAALAEIIARGNLTARRDCGDVAYQVYEVVFYQRPDWQAARDHEHRARDSHFLCWSAAAASAAGAVLSLLGFATHPGWPRSISWCCRPRPSCCAARASRRSTRSSCSIAPWWRRTGPISKPCCAPSSRRGAVLGRKLRPLPHGRGLECHCDSTDRAATVRQRIRATPRLRAIRTRSPCRRSSGAPRSRLDRAS